MRLLCEVGDWSESTACEKAEHEGSVCDLVAG